jgi:serine-type D-Ala-D-Ala carboxypeptidase/endopeptidase (penicillin-binding protein 4)
MFDLCRWLTRLLPSLCGVLIGALLDPTAAAARERKDALPPPVREALAAAGIPEDALVGLVMPQQGFGRRWERASDRPVQPGSTMKLVTSAVALDVLGPNLRGRTDLLSAAALDGDVLRGDLVLRGGADPELGWPQLWQLFSDLREVGVREIAGDILLDRSLFRPERTDQGLPPFDDAPEFYYNVIPDALLLTGNLLGLELASDHEAVRARTTPRIDGIELRSSFTLEDGRCGAWSGGWQPAQVQDEAGRVLIELRGRFPRQCTTRTWLQLIDRDRLADLTLRTLWSRVGGTLQGRVRPGTAPAGARVLAQRLARPWGEVMRPLNKQSDNTLTRLLYLNLGVPGMASDPTTPTAELAAREVRRWMAERRIDTTGLVLDNGSGLSRSERLTARQLAQLLQHALAGKQGADLLMSLPAAGVDGTMRLRLRDSPAAGWARLKTGTLRNVVALAGVVRDERLKPWIFVAIVNHEQASRARPALDALVDWIARGQPLHPVPGRGEP